LDCPTPARNKWEKSVDSALELKPEHLTAYYWYPTLGSDFYSKIADGSLSGPDRETSISQYQYAIDECASHGLYNYWDFNLQGIKSMNMQLKEILSVFPA
jgi:coproporphyrinogen III oxidase-like Fe-S oxidoreductase